MKLLIATDGSAASTRAAAAASRLADGAETRVRVVVVLGHEYYPQSLATGEELDDANERRAQGDGTVDRAVTAARLALGVSDSTTAVRYGNAADEILTEIDEWHPDVVVLGRRDLHGLDRWLLGSVSEKVLKRSRVPVLVVP